MEYYVKIWPQNMPVIRIAKNDFFSNIQKCIWQKFWLKTFDDDNNKIILTCIATQK